MTDRPSISLKGVITIGERSQHQLIYGETKAVVRGIYDETHCAVIYIAEANKPVKNNA